MIGPGGAVHVNVIVPIPRHKLALQHRHSHVSELVHTVVAVALRSKTGPTTSYGIAVTMFELIAPSYPFEFKFRASIFSQYFFPVSRLPAPPCSCPSAWFTRSRSTNPPELDCGIESHSTPSSDASTRYSVTVSTVIPVHVS